MLDLLPHLSAARAYSLATHVLQLVSVGAQSSELASVLKALDVRFPQQVTLGMKQKKQAVLFVVLAM